MAEDKPTPSHKQGELDDNWTVFEGYGGFGHRIAVVTERRGMAVADIIACGEGRDAQMAVARMIADAPKLRAEWKTMDTPPPKHRGVWIYGPGSDYEVVQSAGFTEAKYLPHGGVFVMDGGETIPADRITHWMPVVKPEPPKRGSILDTLDRVHEAGGSAWDHIDDPDAAISEIRGEEEPPKETHVHE